MLKSKHFIALFHQQIVQFVSRKPIVSSVKLRLFVKKFRPCVYKVRDYKQIKSGLTQTDLQNRPVGEFIEISNY